MPTLETGSWHVCEALGDFVGAVVGDGDSAPSDTAADRDGDEASDVEKSVDDDDGDRCDDDESYDADGDSEGGDERFCEVEGDGENDGGGELSVPT